MAVLDDSGGQNGKITFWKFLNNNPGIVLMMLMLSIGTGGGAAIGYRHLDPPRKNPFTSLQAEEQEARRITEDERIWDEIRQMQARCGDLQNLAQEILIYVSGLPPKEWRLRIEALEHAQIRDNPNYRVPHHTPGVELPRFPQGHSHPPPRPKLHGLGDGK